MNSRERFNQTMLFGEPDRAPYFEEGIREEVIKRWQEQGFSGELALEEMFPTDKREELAPEIDPIPYPRPWPQTSSELQYLRQRLDPSDKRRLPAGWSLRVQEWQNRGHVLMLRVHRGLFETLGISDWRRFTEVLYLLKDNPVFVHDAMELQSNFTVSLLERILPDVEIDAAIFSEPIGGNSGPLISPEMYQKFALKSYRPIIEHLRRHGVETIILRTYANSRILLPSIVEAGFNCLWACEVNVEAMDYRDIRRDFGRELRLIGGIDLDALLGGKEAIRREIEEKVPPLLEQGGYIPLADGRVRGDVLYENYLYYRRLLERIISAENG